MKNWVCLTNSYFAFSSCLTSQSGVRISGYMALWKIYRTKNVLFGIFFLWLNYIFVITVYATKQGNMLLKVGGVQFTQSSGILS